MSRVLALLLLHGGAALAAPDCEPLDEAGFRDIALLLRSGVDRGDDSLVRTMSAELDARVPCMRFAPEPHTLADVLVLRAIAAYAAGGDWETPMAAALRIWPSVDRIVSSRHPLASWEPPEPTGWTAAEARERLYVDGLPSQSVPGPADIALVQRTDGTWWNSWLTSPDNPLPEGWAQEPVVPPPHIRFQAVTSIGLAAMARYQDPNFESDWVQTVEPTDAPGVLLGGTGRVLATFYSPFGLTAAASGWLHPDSPGLDVHGAGVWAPKHLVLGIGAGTRAIEVFEGPVDGSPEALASGLQESHQRFMLRYPAALARLWWGRKARWEVGAVYGRSAAIQRWSFDAELELPRKTRGARWVLSFGLDSAEGRFEQIGVRRERTLSSGSARTWLGVGWAWGER